MLVVFVGICVGAFRQPYGSEYIAFWGPAATTGRRPFLTLLVLYGGQSINQSTRPVLPRVLLGPSTAAGRSTSLLQSTPHAPASRNQSRVPFLYDRPSHTCTRASRGLSISFLASEHSVIVQLGPQHHATPMYTCPPYVLCPGVHPRSGSGRHTVRGSHPDTPQRPSAHPTAVEARHRPEARHRKAHHGVYMRRG